jgi:hypothetical protein
MLARYLVAALFGLFAYFQLNDPDPWGWVALYGSVAILYLWSAHRQLPRLVKQGGVLLILIWAVSLLPDFINWVQMGMPTITGSMKAEAPHIELTREFLGLVICGLAIWRV